MITDFIKIGCDPELFAKRRGRFVSVHDILPGTKTTPCIVANGAVQVDGVSAEFNIRPAKTSEEFVDNINSVIKTMEKIISLKAEGITLVAEPTATFGVEYFNSLPEFSKALGCEPDYSAYTGKPNPKPETNEPFRTGSGHVHIQMHPDDKMVNHIHSPEYMENCASLVRDLDVSLYQASKSWDKDEKRMSLYGKPGSFRPKTYGVEYRVLSNAWLRSKGATKYVFDAALETTKYFLTEGYRSNHLTAIFSDRFGEVTPSISELSKMLTSLKLPAPLDYVTE